MSSRRKSSLADGAPACAPMPVCVSFVGLVAVAAAVLYFVAAFHDTAYLEKQRALLIATGVLTTLLVVYSCVSCIGMWMANAAVTSDGEPGAPISVWRLACFVLAAFVAVAALIMALVALGNLGTSGQTALLVGIVLSSLIVLFFAFAIVYACYEYGCAEYSIQKV